MDWFKEKLSKTLLTPIKSIKTQYIPLLLIYLAYGAQGITSIVLMFWEKENLTLSTEQFIVIGTWLTIPFTLKMIVGQLVDTKPIFGSRRKAYIFLGAALMALGYAALYGLMIKAPWVMWMGDEFTVYLTSGLLSAFGFMIQDVTADTMAVEVVDREEEQHGKMIPRKEEDIKTEISMVQILGRLALMLGIIIAAFSKAQLAIMFQATPEKIMFVALGIPIVSIVGATFVNLHTSQEEGPGKINNVIMGGGILYAIFVLIMAFWDKLIPTAGGHESQNLFFDFVSIYNQEITFGVSLFLLCFLVHWMVRELPKEKRLIIYYVLAAIFIFRMTPGTGPGFSWWAIDVLGFDRAFFGTLAQISAVIPFIILWLFSDYISKKPVRSVFLFLVVIGTILSLPELGLYHGIHERLGLSAHFVAIADTVWDSPLVHISMIPTLALIAYFAPANARGTWFAVGSSLMNLALTASALGTKYLNKIFVVSREVVNEAGEIITPMDYSMLGDLMLWKIGLSFIISLAAILYFLDKKRVGNI